MEVFQFRIVLLLALFAIASVYDYKTRKIPDLLWVIFCVMGGVTYLFDYSDFTAYHTISILTSFFVGFALYRLKFVGMADMFAIFSIGVILPVHYEFVMMPIVVILSGLILAVLCNTVHNVILNTIDSIKNRERPFSEFVTEPFYKKMFAFFCIHKKRRYEKFVISAENQYPAIPKKRSFVLVSRSSKDITAVETKGFVQNLLPFVVFMMFGMVFLLLPEIIGMMMFF